MHITDTGQSSTSILATCGDTLYQVISKKAMIESNDMYVINIQLNMFVHKQSTNIYSYCL